MTVAAIIPSRFDSQRLPGKALAPLAGEPMLQRLIERVKRCTRIDKIVVATTDLASDDAIAELAKSLRVECFRGSPTDVLGRIVRAAEAFEVDTIVELMGDSPLVHEALLEATIQGFETGEYDYYCSYTDTVRLPEHHDLKAFPVGIWAQVFPTEVMKECARFRQDEYSREHSTTAMFKHPSSFRLGYLEAVREWGQLHRPDLFLAVNLPNQLELIQGIFERCYRTDPNFSLAMAVEACDSILREQAPPHSP